MLTTTTVVILIIISMIITSICNFIKEAISWITRKKVLPIISMGIALVLWVLSAFSFDLWMSFSIWAKILLWLALGTGAQIFYDIRELLKSLERKDNE